MMNLEQAERQMRRCWYEIGVVESERQTAERVREAYHRYLMALHRYLALCAEVGQDGTGRRVA